MAVGLGEGRRQARVEQGGKVVEMSKEEVTAGERYLESNGKAVSC